MEVRYRESFLRDLKKLKKLPIYDKIYTLSFQTLPSAAELREIPGVKLCGNSWIRDAEVLADLAGENVVDLAVARHGAPVTQLEMVPPGMAGTLAK